MKKKFMVMFMVFWMLVMMVSTVTSAENMDIDNGVAMEKTMSFYCYGKAASSNMLRYSNDRWVKTHKIPQNAENLKVISSDSEVVSIQQVREYQDPALCYTQLHIEKAGTADINVTAVVGGKTTTIDRTKIRVYDYKNPVRSFMIGKKEYAPCFRAAAGNFTVNEEAGNYKLFCKADNGWCIKEIMFGALKNESETGIVDYRKVGNNTEIVLKDGQEAEVFVTLYNAGIRKTETLSLTMK